SWRVEGPATAPVGQEPKRHEDPGARPRPPSQSEVGRVARRCGAWVCSTPSQRRDTRRQYGQKNTETTNTPRRPGWSVRNRALMVISPMMSSVLGDVDPTHPRVRGALHVPAGESYTATGPSPRAR